MTRITRRDFLTAGAALALPIPAAAQDKDGLIVHEWGVATIPYGTRITNLRTAGAKSLGGVEKIPGLPEFVATWEKTVGDDIEDWKNAPVPVTKPIVYFYSKKPVTASFKVCVPSGRPNAWWPPAQDYGPKPVFPARGMQDPPAPKPSDIQPKDGYLQWTGLAIGGDDKLRDADGWWALARKTDASQVRVEKDAEKFLFYDGHADYSPSARIDWNKNGTVSVANGSPDPYPSVIALRVTKGVCESATRNKLAPNGSVTLALAKGAPDLAAELKAAGLYAKEAGSLVEIWTDEFFKTDGVRVLILLDRAATDRLLPVEIAPKPAELARVLIVHLECLDDDRIAKVKGWISDLATADLEGRDAASAKLRQLGPLAHPYIRVAAEKTTDAEVKARLLDLLPK